MLRWNSVTANELRTKFLKFFEARGHKIIPSAPMAPENDPTALFINSGMHPLVPYLLGEPHPLGKRLCDSQKCIRTIDIEEVGDDTHLTFFEMLGNWSLGDYFKREAIEWSFEFLTKELKIPLERLAVSVFEGDKDVPRDEESVKIWRELGVPKERIAYLGREDNWWGPAGQTGPCGPDTEIFYWVGEKPVPKNFEPDDEQWVEIWNDVFMEYNKTEGGEFLPLEQKNVDTGMGLERMAMVLQGKSNVFETELFVPIINEINSKRKTQSAKPQLKTQNFEKAKRIMADHAKASVFILAEGIVPSNVERGYVLRRLIRRAVRYAKLLGIEQGFSKDLAQVVIEMYKNAYPEVLQNKDFIFRELQKEEERFGKTLSRGLKEFDRLAQNNISGKEAFDLYQSYGFPIEMTKELAKEQGKLVDEKGFEEELKKHQELSRAAGKFKSGLADNSERTIKYHTATHLLHTALRHILGPTVGQMGSNITPERLRFDFSFERKLTEEEINKVEELVNRKIREDLPVQKEEMTHKQAESSGALAFFKERYPENVTVYSIDDPSDPSGQVFSREICAGPHVKRTSELGKFKIVKEESVSAGVRRIRAVLE